jgi:DNA-directed RNA polymerase subunit RPC12/RpoP
MTKRETKPNQQDDYENMVRERMTKYKCSRIVVERAQNAFWNTDEENADKQLARNAGTSTLEEYLQFFADHARREDVIIRAQIGGEALELLKMFFPWLGTEDSINGADQVDTLNELYQALQPPAGDTLRCPHCGYDGEEETPEGTFRILSDEAVYREVIGEAINTKIPTLMVESLSFHYKEDEEKRDRVECRSCFGEFPIPSGLQVSYQ